jgi:hypothetical protein
MDILERHFIAIDTWSVLFPDQTTFLLSHLHTDHADIPKSFKFPVYAFDAMDELLILPMVRAVLRPNSWYRTHKHHIPFKVCKTMHTADSIGFYFPSLSVLFMGDGVQSIIPPIQRPLTIVYDGLYENIQRPVPTTLQACAHIQKLLTSQCTVLQLVHHGILSFIASSCHTMFCLHPSTPVLVQNTARYLKIVDDSSPFMLVGRSYHDGPCIVPSSYWFMRDPLIDLFSMYREGDKLRVFCTLHALPEEIKSWKSLYPYAHFEPLSTTSIHRTPSSK